MKTSLRFDRARRRLLRAGVGSLATTALGPLLVTERTAAQTRTLYVNSWGGSYTVAQEAAYFKPFTAATGIQIRTITPVSFARIKAQVQTGNYQFDMTSVNSMLWLRASREGLAEPIDWTVINRDALSADAIVADGHGIACNIQGTNLWYRRDKFPNGGPRSWADFWDIENFPGTRSLCSSDAPRSMISPCLRTECRTTSSIRSISTVRFESSTGSSRTSRCGGEKAINPSSSSATARLT